MATVETWQRTPETQRFVRVAQGETAAPRGERRYRVRWRDPAGDSQSKTFRRQHDAEHFARDLESAKDAGTYRDPKLAREPFGAFAARYLASAPGLRPKTRAQYEDDVRLHIAPAGKLPAGTITFSATPLGAITAGDVRDWYGKLKKGEATKHHAYRTFRTILSAAVREDLIVENPAARLRIPTPAAREMRYLTPAELASLADEVSPRYRALVLLLGYRGLRFGEAAGLRRADVNVLGARVLIERSLSELKGRLDEGPTKTGARRAVHLPRSLADELAHHLEYFTRPEQDAPVFTTELGNRIRSTNFRSQVWVRACRRVGISPPRIHDLRHTAVTIAISAGAHPKEIQEMCGHSSIAVTFDVYGHLFDTLQEATADKVDAIMRASAPGDVVALRPQPGASSNGLAVVSQFE